MTREPTTKDLVIVTVASMVMIIALALPAFILYSRGSTPDTSALYDAKHYYLKADGRSYLVVILRDGSHALVQEPVE